jgi:hypothetical protein
MICTLSPSAKAANRTSAAAGAFEDAFSLTESTSSAVTQPGCRIIILHRHSALVRSVNDSRRSDHQRPSSGHTT